MRADGVLADAVDGRRVLVTPDGAELLTLNETGSAVWDALAGGADVDDLVERLSGALSVDADTLRSDLRGFLGELHAAGVIATDLPS